MSITLSILCVLFYILFVWGQSLCFKAKTMILHGELNTLCPRSISGHLHELESLGSLAGSCCTFSPMIPGQYSCLNKTRTGSTPIHRIHGKDCIGPQTKIKQNLQATKK